MKLYTDGGARGNPGPGAIGVLLCDANGEEVVRHSDYIGDATNNVAEYCALVAGLELAKEYAPQKLECFLDSELVVKQLTGSYKIKNEKLQSLTEEIMRQKRDFPHISFTHLPRTHEKMKIADALVNHALDTELNK